MVFFHMGFFLTGGANSFGLGKGVYTRGERGTERDKNKFKFFSLHVQ